MKRRVSEVVLLVAVVMLMTTGAHAESDLGVKGLGLSVGALDAEGLTATATLAGLMHLGTIARPDIPWWIFAQYWSKGTNQEYRDWILGTRVAYRFHTKNEAIRPYAGAGVAFHFFRWNSGTEVLHSNVLGFQLGGGVGFMFSDDFELAGEAWFDFNQEFNQFSLLLTGVFWN